MSKKSIVIIVVLAICNCWLLYTLANNNRNFSYIINSLSPYSDQANVLTNNLLQNIEYVGSSIPANTTLTNVDGDQFTLESICTMDSLPIIIVRFSSSHCSTCVDYSIKIAKELLSQIDAHVIFIGSCQKLSLLGALSTSLNITDEEVYNCDNLGIDIEYKNFPYYLVIGCDMNIKCCYFPTKNMNEFDINTFKRIYNQTISQ